MEQNEKKFSNFIGDLKSSNIASNITSLHFYSGQIGLLLNEINPVDSDAIVDKNLKDSKEVIKKTLNDNSSELTNDYIKFGDTLKSILSDLNTEKNSKYLKKIAVHYLDIAKLVKDERVKNLSFAIADELSSKQYDK